MNKEMSKLFAEMFGTFLLATAVLMGANPFVALGILVLLIGAISGSNVNPIVSVGLASVKKLRVDLMVKMIGAQLVGALLARVVFQYLRNDSISLSMKMVDFVGRDMVGSLIGGAVFLMGLTMAIHQKLDGIKLAVAIGGSLLLGAMFGGINAAVDLAMGTINIGSIVGMLVGAVIGSNLAVMLVDASNSKE